MQARSVHQLLSRAVRAGLCPGSVAGWSFADGGVIHTESAGAAEIGTKATSVAADTWYDLASLTKPLVGTTLFLLARREGGLDLNSRVGDFLSEVGVYHSVTLENLLTHTSGLPGWAPLYSYGGSPEDVLQSIRALDPIGRPGERFEYSCPGFILLGLILEKVIGSSLARAFNGLVAEPLKLTNDLGFNPSVSNILLAGGAVRPTAETLLVRDLGLDPATIPRWSPGQADDGNARFLGGVAGNAGLFGTVRGVMLLAQEYLPGGGLLLNSAEADLSASCRTPRMEQPRALGWQIAAAPGSSAGPMISPNSIGHVGFTGTSLWVDRQKSCVMALLSNRHHPGHRSTDLHPLRRRFNALARTSHRFS